MPKSPPPHLAELQLTELTAGEIDAFNSAAERGFQEESPPEVRELDREITPAARFFGFKTGDRWISTFGSFERRLTVPGGSAIDISAVTAVTVHSAYRRRGLLRRMMSHEFERAAGRGEIAAALYASESLIYGRFGFGSAAPRARYSGSTRSLSFRPEVAALLTAAGSVDEVDRDDYLAAAGELHDRLLADRPGALDRPADCWRARLLDPSQWRDGATPLRYVLTYDAAGAVVGHATYRIKDDYTPAGPNNEVRIDEVEASGPEAYARLWRYLLDLDLARRFVWRNAPLDDPIRHMVTDARAVQTASADGLYVRLLDIPAALSARRYSTDIDLVFDIHDEVLAENSGNYRLTARGGQEPEVSRTDQAADLSMSVCDLSAVYLGGVGIGALHDAGLVTEYRAGATAEAAAAFTWHRAPHCADFF